MFNSIIAICTVIFCAIFIFYLISSQNRWKSTNRPANTLPDSGKLQKPKPDKSALGQKLRGEFEELLFLPDLKTKLDIDSLPIFKDNYYAKLVQIVSTDYYKKQAGQQSKEFVINPFFSFAGRYLNTKFDTVELYKYYEIRIILADSHKLFATMSLSSSQLQFLLQESFALLSFPTEKLYDLHQHIYLVLLSNGGFFFAKREDESKYLKYNEAKKDEAKLQEDSRGIIATVSAFDRLIKIYDEQPLKDYRQLLLAYGEKLPTKRNIIRALGRW